MREPFDEALIEFYGTKPDHAGYRRLVERAAQAGDDRARYAMATWYLHGAPELGVKKNHRVARTWLEAAARSSALAMHDLAFAHETGRLGLRRDARAAYRLYRKSMRYGSVSAHHEVARCLFHGIGVKANRAAGEKLFAIARELGYEEPEPRGRRARR